MIQQIFVNLPVKNLKVSVDFFAALGFTFNPQFTNENATCMIVGENIFVMLLVNEYFETFIDKPVSDATKATEMLIALPLEDRPSVDRFVGKAVRAGASTPMPPKDYGFMYQHGFADLDGHQWEVFHMAGTPD